MILKPKCEKIDITINRTSCESRFQWKEHFQKNPLHFRICADLEVDNEKNFSSVGNKTTNIYKQNPVLNGYRMESELKNVLQSGWSKSLLGYDDVDWFVTDFLYSENKMNFYLKNTKKDNIMTKKLKKILTLITVADFVRKILNLTKLDIIVV